MNTEIVIKASEIPYIRHDEAMAITAVENHRLWELLIDIKSDEWTLPTDCTGWDVRAIVVHLIAAAEAQASLLEFVRQTMAGRKLTEEISGVYPVDGMNEAGLTRDVWMHRVDLAAPSDAPLLPRPNMTDGIVADINAEWATTHTDPFTLKLTGPAGGTFVRDATEPGDCLEVGAIDCCRILSGRGTPVGVLHHPLFL